MSIEQKLPDSRPTHFQQFDVEFALKATGFGVWELDTKNNRLIWDDRCQELFGLTNQQVFPYEQAIKHIHAEDADRVHNAVQRAVDPRSDGLYDETYRTIGANDGKLRWVRFYGRAYPSENGSRDHFAGLAHEVTEQKMVQESEAEARLQIQRQQRVLETISSSTPDLMYVFDLNYRFTYANKALLSMWGSTWEDSIGKGLLEIGYEPWHAEMHEREIDQVVATKQSIRGVVSFPHATLGKRIYDYVFSPVFDENGEVEAIAGTTRDITDLNLTRQELVEKEAALSNAIELAELGTWSLDAASRTITMSPRVANWLGSDEQVIGVDSFLACIAETDREQVRRSFDEVASLEIGKRYDQICTIIHSQNGHRRIIHTLGRIYIDDRGEFAKIEGTAQDITAQRELTLLLEQQVMQRTEELAGSYQKLEASNLELEYANGLLKRSNENLQNFAYVASHDLQEPLRKIQQFGNLLAMRQSTLSEQEMGFIGRMQSAASRMALLIKDLLDFSRVSTQREEAKLVPLNRVVDQVLETLEFAIADSDAQIRVEPLADVKGDASQLGQLFQNLLSNALKFHRPDLPPVVHITGSRVPASQLPASVTPLRPTPEYYRIDVTDNGIGFDERYLDRIFQVFQRLHGKSQYSGTGIGLAICERVVANHGGAITANSTPGTGSTFSIFLPIGG
ncbi:hypothetical protein GCM10010967_33530 [Dyadobacter beijingensis]|uniref:histidine kinase n=1 Tax=Dyadobacter beijingensis TaxID=365489 RepID=A0ABQ2I0K8_9BACT|nr:PAS domain-containing sensor histidine kinase [Dyadobacter beijingensis]GGM97007.1 hypothetical protein GCM10010967_33530 [Dyadobacter beijingensis]